MFCLAEAETQFLRLEQVCNKSRKQVNAEVDRAPMSDVFNLLLVLELVIDGIDDAPPTQHELVHEGEQSVSHVFLDAGHR